MPHAASAVSRLCLAAALLLLAAPSAGAAADKPATNDPYTVSLPNGVTLQLFAVAASPSLDRPWWKPDGSAIDATSATGPSPIRENCVTSWPCA